MENTRTEIVLRTTLPISNAEFGVKSKVLCIFIVSAKSLGFCSGNKNLKQNKKLLLRAQTETKKFPCSPHY